jgi:hypothetical protein
MDGKEFWNCLFKVTFNNRRDPLLFSGHKTRTDCWAAAFLSCRAKPFPVDVKWEQKRQAQQEVRTGCEPFIGFADWIPREPKSQLRVGTRKSPPQPIRRASNAADRKVAGLRFSQRARRLPLEVVLVAQVGSSEVCDGRSGLQNRCSQRWLGCSS